MITKPGLLPKYAGYAIQFVVGVFVLGIGFSLYDTGRPPKLAGTIDWNKVLLAGACGGVASLITFTVERWLNRYYEKRAA